DLFWRNTVKIPLYLDERLFWLYVARDDEDRIVGRIPGLVELLEHGAGRLVEGLHAPKRAFPVRCALEHGCEQLRVEDELGTRVILGHLLFDGPPLLGPQFFAVKYPSHP